MGWKQSDLDNLDAAIASGVLQCDVGGRRVVYQSSADLLKARQAIARALSLQASGTQSYPRFQVATFDD